jgi:hypothetical protein
MGLFHELILLSNSVLIHTIKFINRLFIFGTSLPPLPPRLLQKELDLLIAQLLPRWSLLLFRLSYRRGPGGDIMTGILVGILLLRRIIHAEHARRLDTSLQMDRTLVLEGVDRLDGLLHVEEGVHLMLAVEMALLLVAIEGGSQAYIVSIDWRHSDRSIFLNVQG